MTMTPRKILFAATALVALALSANAMFAQEGSEATSRYGNFDKLAELSENRLHAILEDAAAGKINDPDASKVAAAYASFMDEALAGQLDAKPIERERRRASLRSCDRTFALDLTR